VGVADQVRLRADEWGLFLDDADGRQIVVAGPGTGKTQFLVERVTRLIASGRSRSSQVIVLSFSRRATARLRGRIEEALGTGGVPVDVTTYHSLAIRLIETVTGRRPIPLTTPEQVSLVRQVLIEENATHWPLMYREVLGSQAFSAEVADFLLRCSERLLTPDELAERAAERDDWRGLPGLYSRYLQRLQQIERTDYGVLLANAVALLGGTEGADIAAEFQYVVVDEYQDTSPAQAEMAELLARSHGNLTVAGDPYQSIFSFRGAEVRNIAAFSEVPGTRRLVLAESLRVPAQIMEAALRVVSGGDLPGSAGPVEPAGHEGSSEAYIFDQETAEAEWIAREVEHLVRVDQMSPAKIAVVVRSKRQLLPELSRALDRRGIPHDPPDSRLADHPAVRLCQDLVLIATRGGEHTGRSPTAPSSG
jgi:superfamily I DNA/RNA helicase